MSTDTSDALIALSRLRQSWVWLGDAMVPGKAIPLPFVVGDDKTRRIEADQRRADREAAAIAVKYGRVPNPHPDAPKVGPLSTRAMILLSVVGLSQRMWFVRTGERLQWAGVTDPSARSTVTGCWTCDSAGVTHVPHTRFDAAKGIYVHRIERNDRCPDCRGFGRRPSGHQCGVCGAVRQCSCDLADAYMSIAQGLLYRELTARRVVSDVAVDARKTLFEADQRARRACNLGELEWEIPDPCRVCRRRSMWAVCTEPDAKKWVMECRYAGCVCTGAGCRCGRPQRVAGQRHRWPAVAPAKKRRPELVGAAP